jgi:hypothetical protein
MSKVNATTIQNWTGIGLILASGAIHAIETPEYFEEMRYIGVLFALSVLGAIAAAIGIGRGQQWGWSLGTVVAAGSILGYLLSRTIGLPGFRENSWEEFVEPMGLLSLLVESLFVALAAWVLSNRSTATAPRATPS